MKHKFFVLPGPSTNMLALAGCLEGTQKPDGKDDTHILRYHLKWQLSPVWIKISLYSLSRANIYLGWHPASNALASAISGIRISAFGVWSLLRVLLSGCLPAILPHMARNALRQPCMQYSALQLTAQAHAPFRA